MSAEIWTQVAPGITHHVQTLLTKSKIGVCSGTLRIIDYGSSCPTLTDEPCLDRFKVVIPYGGHSVTWEILFNFHRPEEPPDFLFSKEDKLFLPEIDNIKSLAQWVPRDPYALTKVVSELLEEYKRHQRDLIQSDSRLLFEYRSLLDQAGIRETDIEIYAANRNGGSLGSVSFLIRLSTDFSRIPAYMNKDNPGADTAVLLVTFQGPDGLRVTPQLFLSPRLEHALGGSSSLRIPPFPSGTCLIDYLPTVTQLLQNKVDLISNSYEKRRDYISAFLSYFGRTVLEYDTESFTHISFLMEWHDFYFTVTVTLTSCFPSEMPRITFLSIYHEASGGQPYAHTFNSYPYSPRWSAGEMADRTWAFLLKEVSKFQKKSISEGCL